MSSKHTLKLLFFTDGCFPHYKCVHLCVIFIRYMKGKDAANWVTVDSVTGEIRLAKNLDYESPHVVNGTYTITMLGVTTGKLRGFCVHTNWFVCLSTRVVGLTYPSLKLGTKCSLSIQRRDTGNSNFEMCSQGNCFSPLMRWRWTSIKSFQR